MDWLALITLAIKAIAGVSDYLSRRQLLDAGKAEILTKGLQSTLDNIQRAKNVSEELTAKPDGNFANRVRDKYTRSE